LSPTDKTVVLAIDSVSGNICTRLQEKILSKIPDDASKTMGLQKILNLGKGPPYELCLNIDVSVVVLNVKIACCFKDRCPTYRNVSSV
jgi:hypothetical protein